MRHRRRKEARLWTVLVFFVLCAACSPGGDRAAPEEPGASRDDTTRTTRAEGESSGVGTTAEETAPEDQEGRTVGGPVEVETSVVATDLEAPWGLAFLPGGDALVTERDTGRLLRVDASGEIEEVQRLPADGVGEGGLLGVALSPDYEEDGLVYAYYSTPEDNRVVRFRLGEEP